MAEEWRDRVQERIDLTKGWLVATDSQCFEQQKHLDADSTERIYWHYGYLTACQDILKVSQPMTAAFPSLSEPIPPASTSGHVDTGAATLAGSAPGSKAEESAKK